MRISTFFYFIWQGIKNLFRNQFMSVATIAIVAATLFITSVFYILSVNINYGIRTLEQSVGFVIFFNEGTSEADILAFKALIESRTETKEVDYISPEQAWEKTKSEWFAGKEDILSYFEENPLKNAASLTVKTNSIKEQSSLLGYIKDTSIIRTLRYPEEMADKIVRFDGFIRYVSVVMIGVLTTISIFLISLSIKVAFGNRQKEIRIMKNIGATNFYIKGPFVVEGLLLGVIGAAIPFGLIFFFYDKVISSLYNTFVLFDGNMPYMPLSEMVTIFAVFSFGIGIAIGLMGSIDTVNKSLKQL